MGMRLNTFRYHVSDIAILAFGSATEPPPPPPPTQPQPQRPGSRPSSAAAAAPQAAAAGEEQQQPPQPRRHVLLLSVDVRGLAVVWDVWGGGVLHSIHNVQGADLVGSRLLWLQVCDRG